MDGYWWIVIIVVLAAIAIFVAVRRRQTRADGTAQQAYIDGLRSIIAGDRRTAFVKLRQAVDLDTENIDAYLKLGDLFREKGLVEKALQIHRELTLRRGVPVALSGDIHRSLAEDYLAAGLEKKAEETLREMIKRAEQRNWAEDRLLELYIKGEEWEKAEELLRGVMKDRDLKESSTMSYIKLMIGRRFHDNSQFHKARIIYKESLSLNGGDPFPYLYIAESYLRENRINDGLGYLKKLCENVPDQAYLGFSMIEETLFDMGRFSEVEDIYRGVLGRDPENMPATLALAGILEKKGEYPEAENLLRSVLDIGELSQAAALKLAKLLAASGRVEEGLEILSDMAEKVDLRRDKFICANCGNVVKEPLPYCRKCGSLGSFI
jgi:lipopolysaccharide biosynthesis regulator YciM